MWLINQTLSFFKYFVNARTPAQVHSPYLFDLLQFILDEDRTYYAYEVLEDCRRVLLLDKSRIDHEDHGAGSRVTKPRRVSDIARHAVSSSRKCAVFFKLAAYHQPQLTIEIGTSLGLSTAYLASAHPAGKVITFDGSPAVLQMARRLFDQLRLSNVAVVEGPFSDTLQPTLERVGSFDLAFIDGNHRYQPTVDYFQRLAASAGERSIIVIDDIRWSGEMWRAWKAIRKTPGITATIDLFSFGIVFFRPEFKQKTDLQIIPGRRLKPAILR